MSWTSALSSILGGASGSGTFGAWDGGWSTYSSGQSRTKYALEKAYEMQRRAWKEGPSAIRAGLEKAGVNPLLATSAFGNVSAPSASFSDAPVGGSSVGFDGLKSLTAGYYWPYTMTEAKKFVKRCDKCQRFAPLKYQSAEQLNLIVSPWPFAK